jgi:hypothetical protein
MPILIGTMILTLACALIVVLGINYIFPSFFKLRLKRIVDIAICVFGLLSPFAGEDAGGPGALMKNDELRMTN